jgi:hypothetical protein
VKPVLEELRRLGYSTAIMSNFTEAMLGTLSTTPE